MENEEFISALDKQIEKIGHVRLLILDPLTGVVSLSRNDADQVRNFLSALKSSGGAAQDCDYGRSAFGQERSSTLDATGGGII